jgi:hypothetical protein
MLLRRLIHTLPLLGALLLLPQLPTIAENPIRGNWPLPWQIDALRIVFLISLGSGLAVAPLRWRTLAASLLILLAVPFEHLLALPAALLVSAVVLRSWRWLAAAIVLAIAFAPLRMQGSAAWSEPHTLTSPIFLLLITATYVGINGYPVALARQKSDPGLIALQPIWLLPVLHTFAWGPWNNGWTVATVLLGGATALWGSAAALWTPNETQRMAWLGSAWLGSALAGVGLATTVGAASALWQTLIFGVSIGLLRSPRTRWLAAPIPLTAPFVAAWLAQGAAAASGVFLLTGALWLSAILSGLAVTRFQVSGFKFQVPSREYSIQNPKSKIQNHFGSWFLVLGSFLLGILAPLPLRFLIVPAIEPLQAGLTPFGLLDIWPWVGIAALDAGQRRVAVLPSIAVAVLALVAAALVWLLARAFGWTAGSAGDETLRLWDDLRDRVWWAGSTRHRG